MSIVRLDDKDISETDAFSFDFSRRLAPFEAIESATVTIVVVDGADSDPSAMLQDSAAIQSPLVTQMVTAGVAGVSYNLKCAAVTSAGRDLLLVGTMLVVDTGVTVGLGGSTGLIIRGPQGIEGPPGSPPELRIVHLSDDYTLQESDDETVFVLDSTVIVTVPELADPPSCIFMPKAGASVTLHPTGAVTLDSSTTDVLRSVMTDPNGFALVPNYGTANAYVTTKYVASFGDLLGAPSDNAALSAALALKVDKPPVPVKLGLNLTLNAATAGPGVSTYQNAFVFVNAAPQDRTVTIGTGIRIDFKCDFARGRQGVGNLIFAFANNVTVWTKGNVGDALPTGATLAMGGTAARLICTGTQDQFFLISDDLT